MDLRLREIAGQAAGTYFIVTDNSGVAEIEQTSNLRLLFINVETGPTNTIVIFKQGDKAGLQSIFGKSLRKHEKQGNFSIRECLSALDVSSIAVMNLRVFDDTVDKAGVFGISPNKTASEKKTKEYTKLFNTNGLWTIKPKNIPGLLTTENLLNFGNVGNSDISFFVTVADSVDTLTTEGDKTLMTTDLAIEDFPALKPDMLVKDTFVDVWIFNNTFDPNTVSTNKYYGQLFNQTGLIDYTSLEALSIIAESGFARKVTGSLIPNLKNEFDEALSIDTLLNGFFAETGLVCYINDDLLELTDIDDEPVIDTLFNSYFNASTGALVDNGILMSHRLQTQTGSYKIIDLDALPDANLALFNDKSFLQITGEIFPDDTVRNKVYAIYENGIRVGNRLFDADPDNGIYDLKVIGIEVADAECTDSLTTPSSTETYTKVILTLDGPLIGDAYVRVNDLMRSGKVIPTNLNAYLARSAQFTNGSAAKQNEILDMMISPGIVKGLKNFEGIRYLVDCFKSFVEGNYKSQYGQLAKALDKSNKFVRCILNEPFIEDLEKSTNPLFKQSPSDIFDLSFLSTGGNANYSTNFLVKFPTGAEMCFFFGSKFENNEEYPTAVDVSNLFVQKTFAFDVVANATGYLDGVTGLPIMPDDDERKYMEKFRWNPIIKNKKGFTIYGNSTGQKTRTALAQIHNSELLAYIKESLYNMSRDEAFKKGTYNEYLTTEVQVQSFMNALALQGAIKPNPVVVCSAKNNTEEISKQRIKLIHIEYFNIDSLDKVVFDLDLK